MRRRPTASSRSASFRRRMADCITDRIAAESQAGVRCILPAIGAELLDYPAHLRIGKNADVSEGQGRAILGGEIFDLAGKRQGGGEACADRDDAVIGEQTGPAAFQRGNGSVGQLL